MPDDLETRRQHGAESAGSLNPRAWSSSDLLASILDGVADGIAAHDASGQLLFMNDAGARVCGYRSSSDALAAAPDDFSSRVEVFDEAGVALCERELPGPQAALGRIVPERIVRVRQRETGGERWISVKATPILDDRKHVRMSISIFRDVTRERRAEEERQRFESTCRAALATITEMVESLREPVEAIDVEIRQLESSETASAANGLGERHALARVREHEHRIRGVIDQLRARALALSKAMS